MELELNAGVAHPYLRIFCNECGDEVDKAVLFGSNDEYFCLCKGCLSEALKLLK